MSLGIELCLKGLRREEDGGEGYYCVSVRMGWGG